MISSMNRRNFFAWITGIAASVFAWVRFDAQNKPPEFSVKTFRLSGKPAPPSSLWILRRGKWLKPGDDYTLDGATITFKERGSFQVEYKF